MAFEIRFPAISNFCNIPEKFRCYDIFPDRKTLGESGKLNLDSLFMVESPPNWLISRTEDFREAEHLDLFFILSGSVCYQTAAGRGRAAAGQVMLIPSKLNRVIFLDEESTHIYVRMEGDCANFGISSLTVRNCMHLDEIEAYSRILLKKNSLAAINRIYRRNILENLSMLFNHELYPGVDRDSPEKITRLLDYLHKEEPGKLSVAHTAKKFGMSLSKYRQFCLKNFSKSPNELLDDIRMSRARALLSYSDWTIDAIASELGYSSRFAFSKAFRRINGVPPGKFKRG